MEYIKSQDHSNIAYEFHGNKETVLLFVHGWLGSKRWWENQKDFFQNDYQIVQMDLGGHGDSDKDRKKFSAELYSEDIIAVAKQFSNKKIILIGHSMSGIYVTMASLNLPNVKGIILVDTLKNLDFRFPDELVSQVMDMYRYNFEFGVNNILPQYLFNPKTPENVKMSLTKEFLNQKSFAADGIEAFYQADVRPFASALNIPVRAVNSDIPPTDKEVNLKYFKNFDYVSMSDVGHYPMLEDVKVFNEKLSWAINTIKI